MNRRHLLSGIFAALLVGLPAEADAWHGRSRRRSGRDLSDGAKPRDTADDGKCPCNGGKVCVGKRGGRYCVTSSGRKRYGV